MSGIFQFAVRTQTELEAKMTSVERVSYYAKVRFSSLFLNHSYKFRHFQWWFLEHWTRRWLGDEEGHRRAEGLAYQGANQLPGCQVSNLMIFWRNDFNFTISDFDIVHLYHWLWTKWHSKSRAARRLESLAELDLVRHFEYRHNMLSYS